MGQKVNPISVRLEQSNRHFDSCWYADYQYSNLLTQDLKVKSYINNILKQMRCPESHISMIYMAKKIKILFCYLDPRHSTYKKSSRLYIKVVNKNNNKKKKKRKRYFFKSQFVGKYLCRKLKKIVSLRSEAEKVGYIKYNRSIPFVIKNRGKHRSLSKQSEPDIGNFINKNSVNHQIGGDVKMYSQKRNNNLLANDSVGENGGPLGLTKKASMAVTNNTNGGIAYYKKKKSKAEQTIDRSVSWRTQERDSWNRRHRNRDKERRGVLSLMGQTGRTSSENNYLLASLRFAREASDANPFFERKRSMKYKKKSLQLNNAILPNQAVPYSPLIARRNPFRILWAFYRKKKKKNSTKKRFSAAFSVVSRRGWRSGKRRFSLLDKRPLKKKREILEKKVIGREARQAAFWKYLTNVSVPSMDGKKKKNDDAFSAIWGYLFFNHKLFFKKVIQRNKGFQIWHKSLFIRYLLLFIYKKRFTFLASPVNYCMGSQICQLAMQPVNPLNPSSPVGKFYVSSNLKKRNKKKRNLSIHGNISSIDSQSLRKINFNVDADRIRLTNKHLNSGLLKYHMALESINRIEWFQGRGMAFLWLIFNSVHPTFRIARKAIKGSDQNVIKTEAVLTKNGKKPSILQSRQGSRFLLAASRNTKDNLKLYTYPYRLTQSQRIVVNNLENFQLSVSNKIEQKEGRTDTLPVSILSGNANSFNVSAPLGCQAKPSSKKKSIAEKTEIFSCLAKRGSHRSHTSHRSTSKPSACLRIKQTLASSKEDKKNSAKRKTFNYTALLSKKGKQKLRFNRKKKHNYLENETTKKAFSMPRKSLYPRTAKSKGFLSYIEYLLSSQLKSNVRLFSWKTRDEKKSALFIVEEIVYFLQKRVPFSRIKQQMYRELNLDSMKGIRITYSGRLGGRSKKAQRSRRKTFQWGETSSHVFASKLSFASKNALTIFGKIGIKVWVCYK